LSRLASLKAVSTRGELADLLEYPKSALSFAVFIIPPKDRYISFEIAKKGTGTRTIFAPIPELKGLQTRLSNLLYDCQREINPPLEYPLRSYSHGFQKKRKLSIFSNAEKHRNRKHVFNTDLKNFFPSINFGRVQGYFLKNRSFELRHDIATLIAHIACHEGSLPQGAPTSPVISDLISSILDQRLGKLARKHRCTYSRYVDDLTFSTDKGGFPDQIADFSAATSGAWSVGSELHDIVRRSGFEINHLKTRMQKRESRQSVTGLVVNQKVNVTKQYYDTVRAMCHSQFNTGACWHPETKDPVTQAMLKGKLEFSFYAKTYSFGVQPIHKLEEDASKHGGPPVPSHYRLYRRFLAYSKFHSLERPLIICEGKTDNVYIRCAIASLATKFPRLASTTGGDGKKRGAVSFFKHTDKHAELLSISGGTGELHKFVGAYGSLVSGFHAGGQKQPVIVIVDNDSAAKAMWSVVKRLTNSKTAIDGKKDFYHVGHNLFVVPIPSAKGKSTSIEDLFDKSTLATTNKGKTFLPSLKSHQTDKYYGKEIFSKWVVEKNSENISFTGFEPLLKRLVAVCKHRLTPSK
jgi:RNA-directed DNA polymerase